jgi:hypothetical protein
MLCCKVLCIKGVKIKDWLARIMSECNDMWKLLFLEIELYNSILLFGVRGYGVQCHF